MDYKIWWDTNKDKQLLDATGYLTEFAKETMREFELNNLDELLLMIEGKGLGYWYKSDLSRSDVNTSGHMAETLWGSTFNAVQGDDDKPMNVSK